MVRDPGKKLVRGEIVAKKVRVYCLCIIRRDR